MKQSILQFCGALLLMITPFGMIAQVPGAGTAYDFSSTTMSTPDNASLNPTNISIEAWIKADTWAPNLWQNVIVSKDGWAAGDQGYTLRAGANGVLSFNFSGGGTWREVTSAPLMATGKWYHVAGTYDGATMRIYINGEEVGTNAYAGSITNGPYDLTIGGASFTVGGPRYFDGTIDEVRIWSEPVTETEIRDYMCKKLDASHPSIAALLAHYSFDSPGFLLDASGNGNNLTNVSATQVTSGAAIGDESVYEYGTPYDLSLAYSTIDSIHVQSTNTISTIHLYRVDMAPNTLNASATIDSMDYSHYYGVFVGSSASYNYTLAYNYYGNAMGLTNGSYLNLAGRTDGSGTTWTPQGATVNQPATTVNKTFNSNTEVMLAIACPSINLSVSGVQNLCGTATLDATDQATNGNYPWHDGNGPITGETNAAYTMTATGNYYLVANDGLCVDTSDVINLTINPNPTVGFGTLGNVFCEDDG
ncbi:MAG: LamG domain-containing protein, partial [Crocinitomicaceae bacterium]